MAKFRFKSIYGGKIRSEIIFIPDKEHDVEELKRDRLENWALTKMKLVCEEVGPHGGKSKPRRKGAAS